MLLNLLDENLIDKHVFCGERWARVCVGDK